MAERILTLSEEDVALLREMAAAYRDRPLSTLNRPRTDIEDEGAHGAYVALTPSGGIPAATSITLGSATCAVYKLPRPTDSDILLPEILEGVERTVYNLSSTDVEGDTYIPIVRANSGHWMACSGAGEPDSCHLASLQPTNCLLATTSYGTTTNMTPDGTTGHWLSDDSLFYGEGTAFGLLDFWYADGAVHLSLDGIELLRVEGAGCCWEGGPLTGHDDSVGNGDCGGALFRVCLVCQPCPIIDDHSGTGTGTGTGTTHLIYTDCCPLGIPSTLRITTTSTGCPCLNVSATLVYDELDGNWKHTFTNQCPNFLSQSPPYTGSIGLRLFCDPVGGVMSLVLEYNGATVNQSTVVYTSNVCSPLYVAGTLTLTVDSQISGLLCNYAHPSSFNFVVTE